MMEQGTLLEIPEQPERPAEAEAAPAEGARPRKLKLRMADRSKLLLTAIELDRILPGNHPARAIVALLERVDTAAFTAGIRTWQGQAGRSERDPKTMIAVILYAYTEGIGSMREVARLTAHEPALLWITGLDEISHTELSEFRRQHQAALEGLFAQLLTVLDQAQVINLDQVATDGTRIRTFAGMDTFRRRRTIEQRLEQARKLVQELESGAASEPASQRKQRAQQELIERLEASQRELGPVRGGQETGEKPEPRVSITEPEARMMRTAQGGCVSAYNLQLAAESGHKVIVSLAVSNVGTDGVHLEDTLEQIKTMLGKYPKQALVDTAYVTQSNLTKAHDRQVELVGPLPDSTVHTAAGLAKTGIDAAFAPQLFLWDEQQKAFICPAGKPLAYWRRHVKDRERVYDWYQAQAADCAACPHRQRCVQLKRRAKGLGRLLQIQRPHPLVAAHRQKMETAAAKAAYRKRGEIAEFPNAWLKEKIGLRKFRLRGLVKAKIEVTWACLAYNVAIWRRLLWQPV